MIRSILLALALMFFGSAAAYAAPNCTASVADIAFGTFGGSEITVTGNLAINCTGDGKASFSASFTAGSGTYAARTMKNGTNSLGYNLYTDATYTHIWGDGSAGTSAGTGTIDMKTGTTLVVNVPIYAKLPAASIPPFGSYVDTISVDLLVGKLHSPASFRVTADVQGTCAISATDLQFGTYNGAQLDQQSQITLTCTNTMPWNLGLNAGTFAGATVTTRKMTGPGTSSLGYGLYRNSTRTLNWGNTVGTDTLSGTGTGTAQLIPVYGRIPASQPLVGGSYQDQIIATVTF